MIRLLMMMNLSRNELFCNNCGKCGHLHHICKAPITSIGIICFRFNEGEIEFLMIRRKDTLGFIDFMRGKFSINQKMYILNMLNQMTQHEKETLMKKYYFIREGGNIQNMKDKIFQLIKGTTFNGESYDLRDLIMESDRDAIWTEPEWGFPKGRRNSLESDYNCAIREFTEETGYSASKLTNIRNIIPMEEVFTGSNYYSYRHKYYIMFIPYKDTLLNGNFQQSEVSKMEWKNIDKCMDCIRPYNVEKKSMIQNVYNCLNATRLFSLPK
jgi:8-oxo-dGTP pyrophosphatase MutT (NUDIX family)